MRTARERYRRLAAVLKGSTFACPPGYVLWLDGNCITEQMAAALVILIIIIGALIFA
jgi:hypothetical protein